MFGFVEFIWTLIFLAKAAQLVIGLYFSRWFTIMFNSQAVRHWLNEKTIGLHHRQLLIIELPLNDSLSILDEIYKHYNHVSVMAMEFTHFKATNNIHIAKYQQYLGSQTDALIFDASSGVNLNALYAGIGMVQSNGIVAVILNGHQLDSNGALKFSYGQQNSYSYFTELFKSRVLASSGCIVSRTLSTLPSSQINSGSSQSILLANNKRIEKSSDEPKIRHIELSLVQAEIAKNILNKLTSKREAQKNVSVILGSRGRGKSTLLGVIAARIMQYNDGHPSDLPVVSCALHRNQLHNLNVAFINESRFISNQPTALHNINNVDMPIAFFSPDEIISLAPLNSIVLLDEIASLAPDLVKRIINHFSFVIVTGTSLGYEGSGNGFVKRILPYLNNIKNTCIYELKRPFRWEPGDHIESCFDEILSTEIISTEEAADELFPDILKSVHFRKVEKQELVKNMKLYRQIFALLTQAHYQTTPNDIVRTLDASDCKIFIAELRATKNTIATPTTIAVVIAFEEGGKLLASLAQDISIGKRRVQGHLSAQALSLHLFSPEACTNTFLRINRIAVVSKYYRKGIASALLNYCEEYAQRSNTDYMSVSFGYTQELYKFWLNNNYCLAKIGQRIDTASGVASLLMIKNVSKTGSINLTKLINRNALDADYYSTISDDIGHFVSDLKITNNLNLKTNIQFEEALQQMLNLYVNKQISFQKFAPGLLGIINYRSGIFSIEQLASIQEIFNHLHTKGLHKKVKETLEGSLITLLHDLPSLSEQ